MEVIEYIVECSVMLLGVGFICWYNIFRKKDEDDEEVAVAQ